MDRETWALTFGIAALVFWQPATTSLRTQLAYARRRKTLCCSPSPVVFGLVWPVLYLLITINLILFANDQEIQSENNDIYVAVFVMALINLFFNKTWAIFYNIVFPDPNASLVGLTVYTFLVFATALTVLILEALVAEDLWWSVAFLFGPYVLWTAYATVLMAQFACGKIPDDVDEVEYDDALGFEQRRGR